MKNLRIFKGRGKAFCLFWLMLLTAPLAVSAQETLTIYPDATGTNYFVPMFPNYFDEYTRSQHVVPASALETMYGATITSLKYYTTSNDVPYTTQCTLNVYLKEVSYTSISSFEPKANCTIVYTGTLSFVSAGSGGEVTITFSTPYVYYGGNLLVGIENTTKNGFADIQFYGESITGASVAGNYYYNLGGVSPTQRDFIPKTTFTYTPDYCPKPINLTASDITISSATLSWTPKGEETSWDVQYRMVGATNWIDKGTVTSPSCDLDNLEEFTEYQFRVKPNCTEGANWTDPATFRTLSSVTTVDEDHPYSTGFEGETLDWHFLQDGQTNAWAWGSATQNGGSKSLYVSNNGGTNNQYSVYDSGRSKSFAVKSFHLVEGYYYASFDWKNKGEGNCDFLRVALAPVTATLTPGVYPCNDFYNTLPTDWIALDGGYRLSTFNTWQSQSVEFEVNTEGDYLVVFAWSNDYGGGEQPPAAVDNFSFSYATCPRPTTPTLVWADVNYAIFDWTSLGSENTWNMQYKRADETTWTDVNETINAHPYTLTGLESGTNYQVRVQAGCGSNWTNPFSFTTLCAPNESYPFLEDFNSLNATYTIPDCWNNADGTATLKWSFYNNDGHTGECISFYSYTNPDGSTSFLKTPIMNLPAGEAMQLGFWYKNTGISNFSIYISTDNGRTYTTPLVTAIPVADDWTEMEIPVPTEYSGMDNVVFVFKATSNEGSNRLDLDDVYVEVMPTCFKPKDVHVTALSQHSATLAWTNGGEENTWEIAYSTDPDFDPFTQGTHLTVTENPYTLTDLISCQWHYAYVRAKCSDTDVSKWSTTVCSFFAAETFTVNDGTSTHEEIPLGRAYIKYTGNKSQFIIPASSLTDVSNSRISKLIFYSTSKNFGFGTAQFQVYLSETNQTTFESSTFNSTSDMTLVYSGDLECKNYKMEITFDAPFDYFDGNLMVAFYEYSNTNYNEQYVEWLGVVTDSYPSVYRDYSNWRSYFLPKTTISYASFTKPANLKISDLSATSVTLSWVPIGTETHWDVFYTDNPDYVPTANTRPQFANISTNPYTMTGLPMGHNYYIYVRSVLGDGVSDWSDPYVFLYANQITLNDGTVTNELVPLAGYYVSYNNTYGKFILPASDLQDLIHAEIRQVTFYTDSPADISWGGLTYSLSLMETDLTEMTTSTYFSGGQQCFYGNVSVTGNKMTLTFSEPYLYEGGNLLLYYTTYKSGTVNNVKPYWLGVTTENTSGYGSSYYSYRYSTSYSSTTSGVQSFLPKTTISYVFPDCVKPTNLEVSNISTNAATLSWTAIGSGQTGWEIQYKKADETNYTTVEGAVTNPYTLQDLEPSHGYVARVRAICGNDSYSDWLETTFYTDCAPITLPYCYGFEDVQKNGFPTCWSRYSTIDGYPKVLEDQTYYGYTHTGTHCLYFYGSGDEYTVMAVLPQIPVDVEHPMSANELVFYAAGDDAPTSCQVGVMTDPNDLETFVLVEDVSIPNYWYGGIGFQKYMVSFAGYTGNGTYIAIRLGKIDGQYYSYLYVDDIEVRPIPNCLEPTDLTVTAVTSSTATMQWTAGGEETSWQIQYKLADDEWPDTYQTVGQTPFILEGLTPTTSYQVRVRAVCSAIETSDWTDFASIETYGAVPYFEGFGDGNNYYTLTGWEEAEGNLDGVFAGTTQLEMGYSSWQTSSHIFTDNDMTYYVGSLAEVYPSNSSQYEWFITPNIELSEGCQLSFDLALDYNHSATSGLDDNRFAVVVSEDGGVNWAVLALWDYNGTQGRAYYDIPALLSEVNIALPSTYDNKTVRFAFYVESVTYNSGTNHLYLDNVNVTKCIRPELIVASDITTNSAVLDWTTHGETSWTLQYRIDGLGDWTTVSNLTAHPYTLEGLVSPNCYQVRVKAHNAAGDSEWSNIAIFATECAPINLDPGETYSQYFDGREVPACWSSQTYSGSGGWYFGNTVYEQGNVLYCVEGYTYSSNGVNADLKMPQITVTPGLCLTFHHSISVSSQAHVSAFVTLPSLENFTLWNSDTEGLSSGVTTISLNDYVGQTISFTFNINSTGTCDFNIFDVTLYNRNTFSKQTANGYWNETANWSKGILPEATETVVIAGDAVVPENYIAQADEILVAPSGSLTIADGGQLKHNNTGVVATTQKNIVPYTEEGGWYLISSPMKNAIEPSESLVSNNFDFYRFNQSVGLEWENYQQHFYLSPYFKLFNGKGNLYANGGNGTNPVVTIEMEGRLQPAGVDVEVPLVYDPSARLAGWNLVGNPFACNAYLTEPRDFYVLNADRNELTISESNVIAPMEGLFVQAADANDNAVTFTTTMPQSMSTGGALTLNVYEGSSVISGTEVVDRAKVRFDNGSALSKFSLNPNGTKLFITQGHQDYAVVSADASGEVPVSFKAERNGTYTISVNLENVEFDYLHLIDTMAGADVDMLAEPSYTFDAKTTDAVNRFKIVFSVNKTDERAQKTLVE